MLGRLGFFFIWEITTKMGAEVSTLKQKGYKLEKETEHTVVAIKGDDTFFIKKIISNQKPTDADPELASEIAILREIKHPHILSCKDLFNDKKTYYVVLDYCHGGNLATKIRAMSQPPEESEVLSWIAEICMALKAIHEKDLLHKILTPENIYLTEFGTVCLGGFGKIYENSKNTQSTTDSNQSEAINCLAPEVFTDGTYYANSDIWSLGCILYELCTRQSAFSAETTIKLMPKIIRGPSPTLPETFSPYLRQLLDDILNKRHESRPTAREILQRPFIINCLINKCNKTAKDLKARLDALRTVANGLERVHQGTTIGSLAGGVIGAAGGITSIVGLILAPFTLGASLIVTGVGVGVSVAGGVAAAASNVTNMVNQSSDRKAIRTIIKEFEEKMKAVATWLEQITHSLQEIGSTHENTFDTEGKQFEENMFNIGGRVGKSLTGIAELVRLVQVLNVGNIAAKVSRVVRVAEVATGVLSGLFLAVDIFFIAMDAKEIHNIRQAKAADEARATCSETVTETESADFRSTSDTVELLSSSMMTKLSFHTAEEELASKAKGQTSQSNTEVRSEIMKFVRSIREAADELQEVLDAINSVLSQILSAQNNTEQEG